MGDFNVGWGRDGNSVVTEVDKDINVIPLIEAVRGLSVIIGSLRVTLLQLTSY